MMDPVLRDRRKEGEDNRRKADRGKDRDKDKDKDKDTVPGKDSSRGQARCCRIAALARA